MSTDSLTAPDRAADAIARVKRAPRDIYTVAYMGNQRAPRRPDEAGALAVVDLLFGGRICIYAIAGDNEWRRVRRLP